MDGASWAVAAVFVLGTLALGTGSGLVAAGTADQYGHLERPSWAPPAWVFGPVWTVLYVLVGVAGFVSHRHSGWTLPTLLWTLQLLLNLLWTPLFFGLGLRGWALVDLCALLLATLATIAATWLRARPAALLLLPYLAWVGFATALNAAVWSMNR